MKRDVRYILRRIIIGVAIALILGFIKSGKIFALNINTLNNQTIYDKFTSTWSNFSISDYPFIDCYTNSNSSSSLIICLAVDSTTHSGLTVGSTWASTNTRAQITGFSGHNIYRLVLNSDLTVNSSSITNSNNYADNQWGSGYYTWTNFDLTAIINRSTALTSSQKTGKKNSINSALNTNFKILDFSSFLYTTYMKIDYLDNSYNVIKSVECTDNTDNLCNFNINSNTGSFIKVTYYLSDLIGRNLDFLDNDTYQFQFYISGITEDTKIENLNYWYYFGGSTDNIDSEFVYPQSIKRINNNDSSTFNIAFLNNTGHTSSSVYEFIVYLKTNGSSYDTISIPYNFILNTLGNNLSDIDVSNLNNQDTQIDQTQTMINQNNQMIDNQNETNQKLDEINNTLNDDNISGASSQASDFFSDFTTDSHGLTGIITAPLNLISSITSTTCSPLVLPVPFVNTNLTLPCLSSIYSQYFGSFLTIYQSITFGIVAYWVCVRIFNLVKDFKNPDHDEIEVLDL